MCYRCRYSVEQPKRNKPLLLILQAVVVECERGAGEYPVRIKEVDTMVLEVLLPLGLVPFAARCRQTAVGV